MITQRQRNAQRRLDAQQKQHPSHIERQYRRRLEDRISTIGGFVEDAIGKFLGSKADEINELARQDSQEEIVREISRVVSGVRITVEGQWTEREDRDLAAEIGEQLDLFETRQLARQWDVVMGVDPLFGDRETQALIQEFSQQNLQLIRGMEDDLLESVEDNLIEAVREGQRAEDFEEIVARRLDVGESRAALIARDQVGSMSSRLTQARQEELGVTRYTWSTAGDERVVGNPDGLYPEPTDETMHGDHWARDGETYKWSHSHPDGHPGRPIQCRCTANPVVTDLI